jgi:hypothetical protein
VDDERVRPYRSDPPKWVIALLAGVPFGIAMGLSARSDGLGWPGAVFMATSGVPFGLLMAWQLPRWRRGADQVEAGLAADKLPLARLAASGGPVPADPEIRAAATRIASHELVQATRHRTFHILAASCMLIGTVGAATAGSLWAFLYAFAAGAILYFHGYRPRQLKRRIELLRAGHGSQK